MRHMTTRQLQYALPSQCVFQRLLTYSTVAAYEGPLSSGTRPFNIEHASHASSAV